MKIEKIKRHKRAEKPEELLAPMKIGVVKRFTPLRQLRIVGGYSEEVHLFPFRTEKLSSSAPMVLPLGGRVGRRQPNIYPSPLCIRTSGFFYYPSVE